MTIEFSALKPSVLYFYKRVCILLHSAFLFAPSVSILPTKQNTKSLQENRAIKVFRRVSFSLLAIGISKCVFNNRAIYRKRLAAERSTHSGKGDRTRRVVLMCRHWFCNVKHFSASNGLAGIERTRRVDIALFSAAGTKGYWWLRGFDGILLGVGYRRYRRADRFVMSSVTLPDGSAQGRNPVY